VIAIPVLGPLPVLHVRYLKIRFEAAALWQNVLAEVISLTVFGAYTLCAKDSLEKADRRMVIIDTINLKFFIVLYVVLLCNYFVG
jgi:hypothetical protein